MAGADVVEEEEWSRAPAEDVVDAVIHDVVADGIVSPEADSDADLGPDAVNAAHQDRSVAARSSIEAAEAANIADDLRAERGADSALDAAIGLFPRGNIHAGRGIGGGPGWTYPLTWPPPCREGESVRCPVGTDDCDGSVGVVMFLAGGSGCPG